LVCRAGRLHPAAVEDENIEPAIVVVVEEGQAAADDFDDVGFGVDAA